MTIKRTRFELGLELTETNVQGIGGTDLTREGEQSTDSSDNKLKVRLGGSTRAVVTEDQTQTLTNKTIDADLNSISNIENADIKSGAAIARNKLASGTASAIVANNASGVMVDSLASVDTSGNITANDYKFSDVNYNTVSAKETLADISGTGVTSGGVVSIGTPNTTVTVSDGVGYVTVNTGGTKSVKRVTWSGLTNQSLTFLATNSVTYLAISNTGTLLQQVTPYTNTQSRDSIVIGAAIHTNLTTVNAVNQLQNVLISPLNQLEDLQRSLGFFNVSGNIYSANGANLNINKSAGVVNKIGSNWDVDTKNPNVRSLASGTAITFRYRFQDSTELADTTSINPDIYDLAGVSTAVPSNRFTIQRINVFSSNLTRIQLGQTLYNNMADALAAIQTETFVTETNIQENGLLRGFLIVRGGTTDLTDTARVFFLDAPKFGGVGGVGGLSTTTLQGAYNNSSTPQIVTSTTNGSVDIRRGSAADTDAVLRVQNGAGTATVTVTGAGVVSGASIDADTNTITNIENADIKSGAAIARNKLASGTNNAVVHNNASGVQTDSTDLLVGTNALTLANTKHLEVQAATDSTTTGANASLAAFTGGLIRLTNASLVSLANIPAGANGQELTIFNRTGVEFTIPDSSAAIGTAANRIMNPSNATVTVPINGAFDVKYDSTSSRWQYIAGTGSGTGGSASLDTILQLTASEQLTDWSTGDNAAFLGGGTLAGTFVKETTTPLHGTASYKYTQAAGSLNDYFASAIQSVDLRFRGQQVYLTFPYQYDGLTSDIQAIVYCNTTSTIITTTADVVQGTAGSTQSLVVSCIIPLTCTGVRVGFHVKALNSGKIFSFDDISLSSSLLQYVQLNNVTDWVPATFSTLAWQGLGTVTNNSIQVRRNGPDLELKGKVTIGTTAAAIAQFLLPNNFGSITTLSTTGNSEMLGMITRSAAANNITYMALADAGINYFAVSNTLYTVAANPSTRVNGNAAFANNEAIEFLNLRIPIQGWSAGSTAIVTPTQQISSDTIPFIYAGSGTFTPATLVNAPVGTFITFTHAGSSNTRTQTTSAPTQTTSDMNSNGILITPRSFAATSTFQLPAEVMIQIGKGLSAVNPRIFKSTGKTTVGFLDVSYSGTTSFGIPGKDYNPTTGILTIDAATGLFGTNTGSANIQYEDGTSANNGYLTFNASTTPVIAALPILQPRIATLSDVKASGTAGGSASAATTQTRTLNTLVDSTGIVTSLAANQFTLSRAVYYIEALAPAYKVGTHKIRLRNITAGTTAIIGSSASSAAADAVTSSSVLRGEVTITTATTFELQHYTTAAEATDGLGIAVTSGESETYAVVKIMKVRDV